MSDPNSGARTIAKNTELSELPKSKKKYNVSHRLLFPSIPLSNVVTDNLHLFLQVSNVLIDLLIMELKRQDAIEKVKSFEPQTFKHCDAYMYQTFIAGLGISGYEFYVGETSIQHLWTELLHPNQLMSKPASELSTQAIEEYKRRARQWGCDFIDELVPKQECHPIHSMVLYGWPAVLRSCDKLCYVHGRWPCTVPSHDTTM